MEVTGAKRKKLYQRVKSLIFRRRMTEAMEDIEDEIRNSLLSEGMAEATAGNLKISINEGGHIEVKELPPSNLEQLNLPFK